MSLARSVYDGLGSTTGMAGGGEDRMTTTGDRLEFELVPAGRNPNTRVLIVSFLGIAIIACFVTGLLFVAGYVSGELTVFVFLSSPVGVMFMTWGMWLENRGSVEIGPEMLIVKTGAGRYSYGWDSVGSVRLLNFAQLGGLSDLSARFWRLDRTALFVEVKLLKAARLSLFGSGASTEAFGIPQPIRTLHLHLLDPKNFIRRATPFLRPPA